MTRLVTLSGAKGSRSLGVEMLRGVYPKRERMGSA